jgi:hypothetical protein
MNALLMKRVIFSDLEDWSKSPEAHIAARFGNRPDGPVYPIGWGRQSSISVRISHHAGCFRTFVSDNLAPRLSDNLNTRLCFLELMVSAFIFRMIVALGEKKPVFRSFGFINLMA